MKPSFNAPATAQREFRLTSTGSRSSRPSDPTWPSPPFIYGAATSCCIESQALSKKSAPPLLPHPRFLREAIQLQLLLSPLRLLHLHHLLHPYRSTLAANR